MSENENNVSYDDKPLSAAAVLFDDDLGEGYQVPSISGSQYLLVDDDFRQRLLDGVIMDHPALRGTVNQYPPQSG